MERAATTLAEKEGHHLVKSLPLLIIALSPPASITLVYVNVELAGSFAALGDLIRAHGLWEAYRDHVWGPYFWGSLWAWSVIGAHAVVQLGMMRLVPGATVHGPKTKHGWQNTYKANGFQVYLLTLALFAIAAWGFRWFDPAEMYHRLPELVGALNIFAFAFCILLFIKGHTRPTGPDHGSSGNPIFDFYWGMELHPRILGWDVKHFVNCRFGMMAWVLLLLCFADAQVDTYGSLATSMWVSLGLQFLYLTQFYWRESGYFYTMDVRVDRAGFYLIWGCVAWIPAVYTLVGGYLVMHPVDLAWPLALAIGILGALAILSKNDANRQRLETREAEGDNTIWGKPPKVIRASYTDADGQRRENLLLASGWWGMARHFHYTGEIIGAFCWSVVAGFESWIPYVYVMYLTALLIHRTHRDEKKNRRKYGADWDKYRRLVPWRLLPGLY